MVSGAAAGNPAEPGRDRGSGAHAPLLWTGQPRGVKTAQRVLHAIARVGSHAGETQENSSVSVGEEENRKFGVGAEIEDRGKIGDGYGTIPSPGREARRA